MNSFSSLTLLFVLWLSLVSVPAAAGEPSINQKIKATYLFIIVANGLRYNDAFGNKHHLYTENIWDTLRPLGSICTQFYNTKLTYPLPAQASLLTGVWHIFDNPLNETIRPSFPTIFEYWGKKSGARSYFAASKKRFAILTYSDHRGYGKDYAPVFDTTVPESSEAGLGEDVTDIMSNTTYKKAISYIFKHHPSFVYLNLDSGRAEEPHSSLIECRLPSKAGGCEGEADLLNTYYESIIEADAIVLDLWKRIQRDETYKDKSVFIFLSTHGRHTDDFRGFGDNCRGCQKLNLLIIGPGVKRNHLSKKKRPLIDICPTVGALFGLPVPFSKGNIMKEILE